MYAGNVVYRSAYFGRGSGPILRNYYDCDGFESSLSDCQQIHLTSVRCNHFHDAGIRCEGTYQFKSLYLECLFAMLQAWQSELRCQS